MTDEKLPLTGHLTELRKRIIISLTALMIGFILSFNYSEQIFEALTMPLRSEIGFSIKYPFILFVPTKIKNPSLVFLAPAEAFWMHLKVSFVVGLMLSLPVILHQLWKFISPGLYKSEKKYVIPFVITSSLLFIGGVLFGYFLALPPAFGFFVEFSSDFLKPMFTLREYLSLALKLLLAFGPF